MASLLRFIDNEPFKLVRWFALVSLVPILGVSVLSSVALSQFMTQVMLNRDAVAAAEFVNTNVRAENAVSYFEGGADGRVTPAMERFFAHLAYLPDVIRANVYSRSREVLWSSDSALIGRRIGTNEELELAFTGMLNPEIEVSKKGSKDEHVMLEGDDREFVENYLPIWDSAGERVVGVVEIYRAPGALLADISAGRRLVWIISLFAGALMFLALIWVVHRANQVLERQNRIFVERERMAAVGDMASAVAHGLRNPLASIRSSAEIAVDDPSAPRARELLDGIIAQVDRLDSWISGFLYRSNGNGGPQEEGVGINEILADCVAGFRCQFDAQDIWVDICLAEGERRILADETGLRQAINTLISNGLEAMPDGGVLSVCSEFDAATSTVRVTVTDSGSGIPESVRERSFGPFVTTKVSGLGVGLNLARNVVERVGGELSVDNDCNGGATAVIQLPTMG